MMRSDLLVPAEETETTENEDQEQVILTPVYSQTNIRAAIESLNLVHPEMDIKNIDVQASVDGCLLVVVIGRYRVDNESPFFQFMETFLLSPILNKSSKSWYVRSNIFRVIADSENTTEVESQQFNENIELQQVENEEIPQSAQSQNYNSGASMNTNNSTDALPQNTIPQDNYAQEVEYVENSIPLEVITKTDLEIMTDNLLKAQVKYNASDENNSNCNSNVGSNVEKIAASAVPCATQIKENKNKTDGHSDGGEPELCVEEGEREKRFSGEDKIDYEPPAPETYPEKPSPITEPEQTSAWQTWHPAAPHVDSSPPENVTIEGITECLEEKAKLTNTQTMDRGIGDSVDDEFTEKDNTSITDKLEIESTSTVADSGQSSLNSGPPAKKSWAALAQKGPANATFAQEISKTKIVPTPSYKSRSSGNKPDTNKTPSRYPDDQQIFVGNLPTSLTEEQLKDHFMAAGKVIEIRLNPNKVGRSTKPDSPAFGFVVFEEPMTATKVLENKPAYSTMYVPGKEIRINIEQKQAKEVTSSRNYDRNSRNSFSSGNYPAISTSGTRRSTGSSTSNFTGQTSYSNRSNTVPSSRGYR